MSQIGALFAFALALMLSCVPQPRSAHEEPFFRAPFVLRLRIDDRRYYEEKFDRVPYVMDNNAYLFAGETFGIGVTIAENQISRITYRRELARADVEFKFTQEQTSNGLVMLLVIRNKLKRSLLLDARMTIPGKTEVYKTNVLPVQPGHSNLESWPHPIVQLVLGNFRFSESGAKQPE